MRFYITVFIGFVCCLLHAQRNDTVTLQEVSVQKIKSVNGMGRIQHAKDGVLYEGKKNEVLIIDSLDANKALNNTRQILGRIPGLVIVETESSGFTANGIATRGLNPSQSIEMNTRQNGYNVSADSFGYNEAYYLPPMEAVQRIEFIRGAASLQFGSQFGGMVNYVLKEADPKRPLVVQTAQTMGSFGLYNAFTSASGTTGKWNYYSYLQYRNLDGYRANSTQWQLSGFGKIGYTFSAKIKTSLEYTFMRNRVQMPGGLTDSLFHADPRSSTRSRNWIKSPWNILANTWQFDWTKQAFLSVKTSFLFSNRSLVWRNEDGGAEAIDAIDPVTLQYVPREVEKEDMQNVAQEARFTQQYTWGKMPMTLAAGYRLSHSSFTRLGGGQGSTGSDFNLNIVGNWEYDLQYKTTNVAPFLEQCFKLTPKLSVTPGLRFEYLRTSVSGYKISEGDRQQMEAYKTRTFPLFGLGMEYQLNLTLNAYGNISQAYRPIDYSQLEPFGTSSRIDSRLKDSKGFNSDVGLRGALGKWLHFDVGLFYLSYENRIGVVLATDPSTGDYYSLRTNIANSVHKGIESYVEWNAVKQWVPDSKHNVHIFHSFSYTDARYVSGPYEGKRVEAAVKNIHRLGMTYAQPRLSTTIQWSYTGDAFGDATNALISSNPVGGYIPSYQVIDWSSSIPLKKGTLRLGCNNITDAAYFTRRTDEYPGPGIIPAIGRSWYVGFSVGF
jgi:Fe(3+) dicitrate transport protein